jgi:hypothetical protein
MMPSVRTATVLIPDGLRWGINWLASPSVRLPGHNPCQKSPPRHSEINLGEGRWGTRKSTWERDAGDLEQGIARRGDGGYDYFKG